MPKRNTGIEIETATAEIARAVQIFEKLQGASMVAKAIHAEALGLQTIKAMGAMMAAIKAIDGGHVKKESANDE